MPILPEEFDASPQRRTAQGQGSARDLELEKRRRDDRKRDTRTQDRWSVHGVDFRTVLLAVAVCALLAVLSATDNPLSRSLTHYLHRKGPVQKKADEQMGSRQSRENNSAKEGNKVPAADTSATTAKTPTADTSATTTKTPAADDTPHTGSGKQDASDPEMVRRSLERKRATLEREKKRLADAQDALEAQKLQWATEEAFQREKVEQEESDRQRKLREQENLNRARQKELALRPQFSTQPLGLKNAKMTVKLMSTISSQSSKDGEKCSVRIVDPESYRGALIEGHITAANAVGKHDKVEISFQFETLTVHGALYRIQADLKQVSNSQGVKNEDDRGHPVGKSSKKKTVEGAAAGSAGLESGGVSAGPGAAFAIKLSAAAPLIEFAPGSTFALEVSDPKQH